MNLQSSTLKFDESGEPLHVQQAAQIRAFRAAWAEAGHTRAPRISAIAEADTLLLTVPNQLGVAYNVHVMEAILTTVAPGLGWR